MKILVEKAVIEQALEALESAPVQYDFNSYPMLVMTPDTLQTTLTALRDALAEPELNLNCKSVQKRLATVWGYVKAEQAEQEPVTISCECGDIYERDSFGGRFIKLHGICPNCDAVPQAEQKPVAVVEITYGREPECYVTGNIDDFPEGVFKLYAAPVKSICYQEAYDALNAQLIKEPTGNGLDQVAQNNGLIIAMNTLQKMNLAEQAEQEPVAWRVRGYNQFKTGNPAPWRYVDGADKPTVNKPDCCDFEPLYAAPVRTKDLTDEELMACRSSDPAGGSWLESARAVIAADREKNK